MSLTLASCATLNNGVTMPWLGLGTYLMPGDDIGERACIAALEHGYRHIDTAALYKNEEIVGSAVRKSDVPREHVFVTTKVWNSDLREGTVAQAMDASLRRLQMDYVDLYLIHWPVKGKYMQAWGVMEQLYKQGKVRAIGISNFMIPQLEELLPHCTVKPAVNQVEWHPRMRPKGLLERCHKEGIVFESWSPILQGKVAQIPEIVAIAAARGKTAAQVAIRWALQHEVVVIPKSQQPQRVRENANVYDFELTPGEMAKIDALENGQRVGPDPLNFDF
jgi:methylglyoxal/glyoxal reductase